MTEQEIADWEREITHAEMMQKQRETITFAGGKTYEVPVKEKENEK